MNSTLKIAIVFAGLIALGQETFAQTQKDVCTALNEPINSASNAFGTLSVSISSLDVTAVVPKLDGDLRRSFEEMEMKRLELLPFLEAYLIALEDSALLVKRCAR